VLFALQQCSRRIVKKEIGSMDSSARSSQKQERPAQKIVLAALTISGCGSTGR
jgi:hypothetical protein